MNFLAMDNEQDTRTIETNTDTKKDLQVKVYNNFEELETIQQEWDSFVEDVGSEIFLTFDWCRIWWKYYGRGRDLKIFVFRDNANLVGIIPLFFEKLWLGPVFVRAGKIVGSDFTLSQFCLPVHASYLETVIEKLTKLLSQMKWDIVHIGPIAGLYKHYDVLRNAFEKTLFHSHFIFCEDKGVQTYFQLADDWEKQLAGLKKGDRWDIKRSYKALSSYPTSLVSTCASMDNFEHMFKNFVDMHQSYWQGLGQLGHFGDWPRAHEFHQEVADAQIGHNRLRLLEVKSGTRCIGYDYAYKFRERYFTFLNARSISKKLIDISVGKIVFSELVKKALNEDVRCIDSMRGKYEHKLRLGGKLFPIKSIYIIPKGFFTMIRVAVFRTLARFLNLTYYKIWYCRIRPRLPFVRKKPLCKLWIRTSGLT